jgi:hypothetical protein
MSNRTVATCSAEVAVLLSHREDVMKRWLWRIKLLIVVAMAVVVGSLRAQDEVSPSSSGPALEGPGSDRPVLQAIVDRIEVSHPDPYGGDPQVYSPDQESCRRPQPVADFVRKFGICCWSHHNCSSCGSLVSETRFVFGSCRAFFGEPCMRGPRDLPIPIGNYGYGPVREGCGCP